MKIKPEHYAKLETAIRGALNANHGVTERYAALGLSNMRLNFDLLYASKIDDTNSSRWISDNLYPYLNDTHIGSALAKIVGNDGKDGKGKR